MSSVALTYEIHQQARRRMAMYRLLTIIAVHIAALLVWQVATSVFSISAFVLPSPLAVLRTISMPQYAWSANTLVTMTEIFGGYVLGVAVAIVLAMFFVWSPLLNLLVMPLLVTLNMIPKVALGPLFIVWFSYGVVPNILIVFSICFFPVLLTTVRGLQDVDPDLLDLVKSLKGSRWQLFRKIQFPGALAFLFSGMKVSAILAVAGAVVGEFIASDSGLGFLMIQVQSSLDTAAMLMAVAILTLLGVALYSFVLLLERLLVVREEREVA